MLELTTPTQQTARSDAAGGFVAAMATVAQHSADLFVLVDRDGVLLYANPAAIAMFGVALEDAIGTNAISYLHPDDAARVTERFVELLRMPGATVTDTVRFVSTDDEVRILEIVSTNCLASTPTSAASSSTAGTSPSGASSRPSCSSSRCTMR